MFGLNTHNISCLIHFQGRSLNYYAVPPGISDQGSDREGTSSNDFKDFIELKDAQAKNLKICITAGVGSDHIDLNAAVDHQIQVLEVRMIFTPNRTHTDSYTRSLGLMSCR